MTKMMAASCRMQADGSLCTAQPSAQPNNSPDFSALEWLVVELARQDRLSSLAAPSLARRLAARLFGVKPVNRLADPRLESLRRIAVYGWQHGGKLPDQEVDAFLAAGFSFDQMMLVFTTVRARRG